MMAEGAMERHSAGPGPHFIEGEGSCWHCRARVEEIVCPSCSKLQPVAPDVDFFRLFGLGPYLTIEPSQLERSFYEMSRKFHPDRYQTASAEEQAISLENSAILNKAYRTLRDPVSRTYYLIGLKVGISEGERSQAPPNLLEEIMEVQEARMELKASPDGEESAQLLETIREARGRLEAQRGEMEGRLKELSSQWDGLVNRDSQNDEEKILTEMKEILLNMNYLNTALRDLVKEL